MKNIPQSQKPLKKVLFDRIESEKMSPKSKFVFTGRECLVWFFWLLSVLIGALAVAVSLFVVIHHQYAFYEATHNNSLTFLVDTLPYLWMIIFGTMVYVAIYNLRHTARGYRYPVWMILASSIILSFAGGSALQLFGLGYTIDDVMGNYVSMYMSQEKLEQKIWQTPAEGRLIGKQVYSTLEPATTVVFEDFTGQRWRMDVSELHQQDVELLASGMTVKLLGKPINNKAFIFHACGAFPRMMEKGRTLDELNNERQVFVERVSSHAKKRQGQLTLEKGDNYESASLSKQSVCSTIASVRKMPIKTSL